MSSKPKATADPKPESASKKRKRQRQALARTTKARNLALKILDTFEELKTCDLGLAQPNGKTSRRKVNLQKSIEKSKHDISDLGFDVETMLADAIKYRRHLNDEAKKPIPVTSGGAGVYRLGNAKRHWT